MVKKNTWVQIKKMILSPENRAKNIPDDSKGVPLYMWVKGYLEHNGRIGEEVRIKTITGRIEEGTLISINPYYEHNYGQFVPELLKISKDVKTMVFSDEE